MCSRGRVLKIASFEGPMILRVCSIFAFEIPTKNHIHFTFNQRFAYGPPINPRYPKARILVQWGISGQWCWICGVSQGCNSDGVRNPKLMCDTHIHIYIYYITSYIWYIIIYICIYELQMLNLWYIYLHLPSTLPNESKYATHWVLGTF